MGMFDNIIFKTKCPNCNTKVDDFQSKSGPCGLSLLNYWEVDNFYSICPKCNVYIKYTLRNPRKKISIRNYKRTISK